MPMNPRLLRPTASGFNPRSIAGLTAWWDASDAATITAVSGAVSVWADKSGLGRTLYQGTAANRPATGTRTIGGKNALDFDGSNDCLLSGDPAVVATNGASYSVDAQSARALTIFAVCSSDTPDAVKRLVSLQRNRTGQTTGNANDTGAYLARHNAETANIEMAAGAGDATSNDQVAKNFIRRTTSSFSGTSAEILVGSVSAANNLLSIRRNGIDQALTTRYGTGTASAFLSEGTGNHSLDLGASRGGTITVNADNWDGMVGEVLVYLAPLTTSQKQRVEGYLAWKWGLEGSLPTNHPYAYAFPGFGSQPQPSNAEAVDWISNVIAAGSSVNTATANAVDAFVSGCKADGIWDAVKACCILCGPDTLAGALVPLVGASPTNNNFVAGDYNRLTGLVGNGSNKWLETNRNENDDGISDNHYGVYASTVGTGLMLGSETALTTSLSHGGVRNRNATGDAFAALAGFIGMSRSATADYVLRNNGADTTITRLGNAEAANQIGIFANAGSYGNHRIAFYSIGDSLDLEDLDARVTALITAIGAS